MNEVLSINLKKIILMDILDADLMYLINYI